jgi:asparagine synthase (glutamine-hydrolysing)
MAHSREVRLPLLDRRIAEFALSSPPQFLVGGGRTKRILRDAVRDVVPAPVLGRQDKVGFEPPQARWLAEPAAMALATEVLLDPPARMSGRYDAAVVEADLRAGAWRDPTGLWRALNVELWLHAVARRPSARTSATSVVPAR